MKFVPILKDSLREAIDTKVFYVMVGLSALLTLLTATLSFKPGNPEKIMRLLTGALYGVLKDMKPDGIMHVAMDARFKAYKVVGAVTRDGAPEGPDSPYVVTLAAHCKSADESRKLRDAPGETLT